MGLELEGEAQLLPFYLTPSTKDALVGDPGLGLSLTGGGLWAPQPGSPPWLFSRHPCPGGRVPPLPAPAARFPPQSQMGPERCQRQLLSSSAPRLRSCSWLARSRVGLARRAGATLPIRAQAGGVSSRPTRTAACGHVLTGVCIMCVGQSQVHSALLLQCDALAEAPVLFQASERQGEARPQ